MELVEIVLNGRASEFERVLSGCTGQNRHPHAKSFAQLREFREQGAKYIERFRVSLITEHPLFAS